MAKERYRLMFKFWLDMSKADEENIADIIERLKSARLFAKAVRDGLRLFCDLSQGNTGVLLELFPFVRTALAGNGGGDSGGISKADLERLEMLIKEAKSNEAPPAAASGLQALGGIKPLGGLKPIAPPPAYDDDEDFSLSVQKAEGDGNQATANFLASMFALQNQ